MDQEEPALPETGIQKLPSPRVTSIQAVRPAHPEPLPPEEVEQNRELVWILLVACAGAIWGVCVSLLHVGWDGFRVAVIGNASGLIEVIGFRVIIGGVLGFAGGAFGKYCACRFRRTLVLYWTVYWLMIWVTVFVAINSWHVWDAWRRGIDIMTPLRKNYRFVVMVVSVYLVICAAIGAEFGAIGGAIKDAIARRRRM